MGYRRYSKYSLFTYMNWGLGMSLLNKIKIISVAVFFLSVNSHAMNYLSWFFSSSAQETTTTTNPIDIEDDWVLLTATTSTSPDKKTDDKHVCANTVIVAKYKLYKPKNTSDPKYGVFKRLHKLLWQNSKTFRDTWIDVAHRYGKISIISVAHDELEFDAEWNHKLRAIRIKTANLTDDQIGSLMVFELTNAFQQDKFEAVHKRALAGEFFNHHHWKEYDADFYAYENELIEFKGTEIHNVILDELIASDTQIKEDDWRRYNRFTRKTFYRDFNEYLLAVKSERHISYYKNYYVDRIKPELLAARELTATKRVEKMRDAHDITVGEKGVYRQVMEGGKLVWREVKKGS